MMSQRNTPATHGPSAGYWVLIADDPISRQASILFAMAADLMQLVSATFKLS
jgi:hypothetical protein